MAADDYLVKWSRAGHLRHTGRVFDVKRLVILIALVMSPVIAGPDIH